MHDDEKQEAITLDDLFESLEVLHARLVDLDAIAAAAASTIEELPYLPKSTGSSREAVLLAAQRLAIGKMQSLVLSTAEAAQVALNESQKILDELPGLLWVEETPRE